MPSRTALYGWYKLRWKILKRDKYTCQYCGQSAPNVQLEVDHRVALADGGTDEEDNLITSCWACNRGKNGLRQSIMLQKQGGKSPSISKRRNQVVKLLTENPDGVTSMQILKALNIKRGNVDVLVHRLKKEGKIRKNGNLFLLT